MKMDSKKERIQKLKRDLIGYRNLLSILGDRYSDELDTPELVCIEIELFNVINSLNNCIVHLTKGGF